MPVDFEELKKIYEAVKLSSDDYEIKVFSPWESESGKEYITIKLKKKD